MQPKTVWIGNAGKKSHALRFPWITYCGRDVGGDWQPTGEKHCQVCAKLLQQFDRRDLVYQNYGIGLKASLYHESDWMSVEVFPPGIGKSIFDIDLDNVYSGADVLSFAESVVDGFIGGQLVFSLLLGKDTEARAHMETGVLPDRGSACVFVDNNNTTMSRIVSYRIESPFQLTDSGRIAIWAELIDEPILLFVRAPKGSAHATPTD